MLIGKSISLFSTEQNSSLKKQIFRNANSLFCLLLFLFFLFSFTFISAQNQNTKSDHNPNTGAIRYDSINTDYIIIKDITLTGNKITREHIIFRETGYEAGDTIPAALLPKQLLWIKNRVFNTTLFLWLDIVLSGEDSIYKTLSINVRERFYITPVPMGGLIDRNINEWWVERHHDIRRIYYGINFKIKNIWGLNHTLKLKAIAGFNKKIEANYIIPYVNRKLKTGLIINALIEDNSQVAFESYGHQLKYLEYNGAGRRKYNFGFMFTRRNKFYIQHQLGPYFQYSTVADTIVELNPDYFLKGATYQRSYGLKYSYANDRRDFINYPLKGYLLKIETDYQLLQSKTNLNLASLRAEYTKFIPLNKRFYFAASARGKISAPHHQPYFSQRGLGYNTDYVSGYELYVVDGQTYGLVKTNMKWRLLSVNRTVKIVPVKHFRTIPLSVYLKIYSDAGYVRDNNHNPYNNFLSNRLLVGGGIGIDIVTYYDLVGRIEYSANQLGKTGIFLHLKAGL
jgi:outer membrane protein assembly factor BamA